MRAQFLGFTMAFLLLGAGAGIAADTPKESLGERIDAAIERFSAYSAEKKEEAEENGRELLVLLDRRIDELSEKADDASKDAQEASKDEIEDLKQLRDHVAEKLSEAGETTASTWDRFKSAVGDAVSAFRERMSDE